MLKKEYEILAQFIKKPWKKMTFREVKKSSKKKSESYVYGTIKKFVKTGILKGERVGNAALYYLNLGSQKAQAYTGFVSEYIAWNQKHIPYKDLNAIAGKIPSDFYTFIVTGSYAKKTQKETSDIDVVILVGDSEKPKKIYAELKYSCEMNIPQIHLYVFRKTEFLQMLLNNEANYGKEIVKNNLMLFGAENYFKILNRAMENGFNDKKISGN